MTYDRHNPWALRLIALTIVVMVVPFVVFMLDPPVAPAWMDMPLRLMRVAFGYGTTVSLALIVIVALAYAANRHTNVDDRTIWKVLASLPLAALLADALGRANKLDDRLWGGYAGRTISDFAREHLPAESYSGFDGVIMGVAGLALLWLAISVMRAPQPSILIIQQGSSSSEDLPRSLRRAKSVAPLKAEEPFLLSPPAGLAGLPGSSAVAPVRDAVMRVAAPVMQHLRGWSSKPLFALLALAALVIVAGLALVLPSAHRPPTASVPVSIGECGALRTAAGEAAAVAKRSGSVEDLVLGLRRLQIKDLVAKGNDCQQSSQLQRGAAVVVAAGDQKSGAHKTPKAAVNLDLAVVPMPPLPQPVQGPPVPPGGDSEAETITVQPGDSIYGLARKLRVSIADLMEVNGLSAYTISAGQKLKLPRGRSRKSSLDITATTVRAGAISACLQRDPAADPSGSSIVPGAGSLPCNAVPGSETKSVHSRPRPAVPFEEFKGRKKLPLPVVGSIALRFGDVTPDSRPSRGIALKTRNGSSVVSPADGWVAFTGMYKSFGNIVIVKLGGGYLLLLTSLREVSVQLGQFVLSGEPIAVAGKDDADGSPVIYMELRKDERHIDPAPWFDLPASDGQVEAAAIDRTIARSGQLAALGQSDLSVSGDLAQEGTFERPTAGALADRDYSRTALDPEKALDLVNAYRRTFDLKPLKRSAPLTSAAEAHGKDLAKWDRISHYGSDGSNPWDRVKRIGYAARIAAENVGTGQVSFDDVMTGWKESAGHNKNLLLSDADEVGFALVRDDKTEFKTFWVLVLGSRR